MKTFKQFCEDYTHKKINEPGGSIKHSFDFSHESGENVHVDVHQAPNDDIGYVYIPGDKDGANRIGNSGTRRALNIIKSVTGLKYLAGVRSTGAGRGRVQTI